MGLNSILHFNQIMAMEFVKQFATKMKGPDLLFFLEVKLTLHAMWCKLTWRQRVDTMDW